MNETDSTRFFEDYANVLTKQPISNTIQMYSIVGSGLLTQKQEKTIEKVFFDTVTQFNELEKNTSYNSTFITKTNLALKDNFINHKFLPRVIVHNYNTSLAQVLELPPNIKPENVIINPSEFINNFNSKKQSSLICDHKTYEYISTQIPISDESYTYMYKKKPFDHVATQRETEKFIDLKKTNVTRFCELLSLEKLPFQSTQLNPIYFSDPLTNRIFSGYDQISLMMHNALYNTKESLYTNATQALKKGFTYSTTPTRAVFLPSLQNDRPRVKSVVPCSFFRELENVSKKLPQKNYHINNMKFTEEFISDFSSSNPEKYLTSHLQKYFNCALTQTPYETPRFLPELTHNIIKKLSDDPLMLERCAYNAMTMQRHKTNEFEQTRKPIFSRSH